jgi:hypothetical protein
MRIGVLAAAAACAVVVLVPGRAAAQFYGYPSFDIPRAATREYNFAVADSKDAGTSLVFQWRARAGGRAHVQLDLGLADPASPRADARLVIGGAYAQELTSATDEFPLDMLLTAGFGGSFGDGRSFYRLPVGLSVGHRFPFDIPVAITPYAHPRVAIDFCSRCGPRNRGDSKLGVDVDLGVDVELSRAIALRASVLFAGSDFYGRDNAFGFSLAWTPRGLR